MGSKCNGSARLPVTEQAAGSTPVGPAKMKKKVIIFPLIILYIVIGSFFAFQDVFFPGKYDPGYLQWLQKTPVWERILDILLWPFIYIPFLSRNRNS